MNTLLTDVSILWPALIAGVLVAISHVPLGQQVLSRGIVFIDLAIAQVAGLGVIAANCFELPIEGWGAQLAAGAAALAGALLLTWTERKRPEVQEALIGILFVLASTAQILLLANDPHGGENLKDLLAGQILWVSTDQLIRTAVLTAVFALVWFKWRERMGRIGFYVLFAIVVTASVQLVGVYLVFTSLIVPAVATYRHSPKRQLVIGYALAIGSYLAGLGVSLVTDLPSSPVIVWVMGILGLVVHMTGKSGGTIRASMNDVRTLFESELRRRGLDFSIDAESGRHAIAIGGGSMLVSLQNLQREVANDGDAARVVRFVDSIVASANADREVIEPTRLYWCLEPNDHVEKADFLAPVSAQVDRVLCHWSNDNLITWVTPRMLEAVELEPEAAAARAFDNLDVALRKAKIEISDIDGVALGMLGSELPFKSSLILAPGARAVLEPVLGWPLFAVTPDRDFLYLWAERHAEFAGRVGGVVVREYEQAGYPVSTEVFRLNDSGVEAIGAFPVPD